MIRLGMAPRLPGMSPEAFQQHWRTAHADAAGAIPGVRSYVQNHAVLVDGRPLLPYPGFDACSEISFASLEEHDEGFASEHFQTAVRADEALFVDKSRFSWALTEPELVLDRAEPADPVKLLVLWRAHPTRGQDGLLEAAGRWADVVAADAGVARHERLLVRHDWHEGRDPATCDLVDVVWFDGLDAARAHLDGPAHDAALEMAGAAFGAAHHLARPRTVR